MNLGSVASNPMRGRRRVRVSVTLCAGANPCTVVISSNKQINCTRLYTVR